MITACIINTRAHWKCTECGETQQILQGGTLEHPWQYDEAKTLEATVGFKTLHALCRSENSQLTIPYETLKPAQGVTLD